MGSFLRGTVVALMASVEWCVFYETRNTYALGAAIAITLMFFLVFVRKWD